MAVDITSKQTNFAARYKVAIQSLLNTMDLLGDLKDEYDANGYAPDGVNAYKLTDAVVQAAMPYATATNVLGAIGAVESIRSTFNTNRGYLEALRQ